MICKNADCVIKMTRIVYADWQNIWEIHASGVMGAWGGKTEHAEIIFVPRNRHG
jgi:hypothetical protein